jgi:hypothetical protein
MSTSRGIDLGIVIYISVTKYLLLGRWYPLGLNVNQQRYWPRDSNIYICNKILTTGQMIPSGIKCQPAEVLTCILLQIYILLSLGQYLCWLTFNPRGYHLPSSKYFVTDIYITTPRSIPLRPRDSNIYICNKILTTGQMIPSGIKCQPAEVLT